MDVKTYRVKNFDSSLRHMFRHTFNVVICWHEWVGCNTPINSDQLRFREHATKSVSRAGSTGAGRHVDPPSRSYGAASSGPRRSPHRRRHGEPDCPQTPIQPCRVLRQFLTLTSSKGLKRKRAKTKAPSHTETRRRRRHPTGRR